MRRVLLLIPFALAGCLVPQDGQRPDPAPAGEHERLVYEAFRNYADESADVMEDIARRLERGDIESEAEAMAARKEALQDARQRAWSDLGEFWTEQYGGDRWDPRRAADAHRREADALRELSR